MSLRSSINKTFVQILTTLIFLGCVYDIHYNFIYIHARRIKNRSESDLHSCEATFKLLKSSCKESPEKNLRL